MTYLVFPTKIYDGIGNIIPVLPDKTIPQEADVLHPVVKHYKDHIYPEALPKPEMELESAFFFHYPWAWNFQHWIFDCLPKLKFYKNDIPILVGDYDLHFDFQRDTFKILGFEKNLLKVDKPISIKNLIFSPIISQNDNAISENAINFFTYFVNKIPNIKCNFPNKIYISRKDAFAGKGRILTNESTIEKLCKDYGFISICASELSWKEKKAIFGNAKYIIGPMGAGWCNPLLFSKDYKGIMIEPPIEIRGRWFKKLAQKNNGNIEVINSGKFIKEDKEKCENIEWECNIEDFTTKLYNLIKEDNLNPHRAFYKRYYCGKWQNGTTYHTFENSTIKGFDDTQYRKEYIQKLFPNFHNKTVIDCGTWDGYFSFLVEKLGASQILATDYFCWSGPGPGTKYNFNKIKKELNSKVEDLEIDVPDLCVEKVGKFDIVLVLGLLYHLPSFLTSFVNLCEITKETIIIETQIDNNIPQDYPCLRLYMFDGLCGDPSNWFVPNIKAISDILKFCGFQQMTYIKFCGDNRCVIRANKYIEENTDIQYTKL